MKNMRAVLAGAPRGLVAGAGTVLLLLSWLVLANILQPLTHGNECATDWEAAIAAAQSGQTEYQGRCLSIGGLDQQDLSHLQEQLEAQRSIVDTEAQRFTEDLWTTVGGYLGGFPSIVFATLIGAFVVGSSLSSGLTAWSISNGWRRPSWIRAAVGSTMTLAAIGYLIVTLAGGLIIYFRVRGMSLASDIPAPALEVLAPIPGLFFYGLVAAGIALTIGKGEMAMLFSIVFLTLDFISSAQVGRAPYFPSSFQSAALGAPEAKLGVWTGATSMFGLAAIVAIVVCWVFIRRKDLPDR